MIVFKKGKDLNFYSKINFDDESLLLNRNFKNKDLENNSDLNFMILNVKNKYEDNWKYINKMNPSTSVPIYFLNLRLLKDK